MTENFKAHDFDCEVSRRNVLKMDYFRVVRKYLGWEIGDIVKLAEDDGTDRLHYEWVARPSHWGYQSPYRTLWLTFDLIRGRLAKTSEDVVQGVEGEKFWMVYTPGWGVFGGEHKTEAAARKLAEVYAEDKGCPYYVMEMVGKAEEMPAQIGYTSYKKGS